MATKDGLKSALPAAIIKATKLTSVQKIGKVPKVSKEVVVAIKPFKKRGK